MKLNAGLLSFESVRAHNAELVRQWRNAEHVRSMMIDQTYISPEQQQKWLESIQNKRYIYLIACFQGEPFGVVNLKDIDWEERTAETGVFIGERTFLHHPVASACAIITLHFVFKILKFKKIYSRSLKTNQYLRSHTEKLGFQLIADNGHVQHWILTPSEFNQACQKFMKSVFELLEFSGQYELILDEQDVRIGFDNIIKQALVSHQYHRETKGKLNRYIIRAL